MQPAVTNIAVKFDLKKPKTGTAYQCPDELPAVFAGEKLVVYGLVDASTSIEGTAILNGEILGKPIQHEVPFKSQPSSSSGMYPVHRLAAKALISDWEDARKSQDTIVGLSVESGVVSSHTAFIAVDEESSKPVEGALRTWDIQAEPEQLCQMMSSASYFSYAPDDCLLDCGESEEESDDDMGFGLMDCESGGVRELESSVSSIPSQSAAPLIPPTLAAPTDTLSSVIASQQADGSWQLSSVIFQILSKSKTEVEDACPVQLLGDSPVVGRVWATILVLTILDSKCKGQCDEWELIAIKAEKWLKKQVLPKGVDTSNFYSAARSLIV